MSRNSAAEPRVRVQGPGWKKPMTIAADRYDAVSSAILDVLSSEGVAFTRLVEGVAQRLPDFQGSLAWYTISVARELEARGLITRQGRPVRYARPLVSAQHRPTSAAPTGQAGTTRGTHRHV